MPEVSFSLITALYSKSDPYLPNYFKRLRDFTEKLKARNVNFEIVFVPQQPTAFARGLLAQVSQEPWFVMKELTTPALYSSWNAGVLTASGKVVGFWNVDDIRFVDAVLEACELVNGGADVIYFPFIIKRYLSFLGFNVRVYSRRIDKQLPTVFDRRQFTTGMNCGPHFMFRRSLFKQVGPFDEQFKIVGDFDWCARAATYTDKFVKGQNLSGIFRVDGHGLSAGINPRRVAENNVVYIRFEASANVQPVSEELAKAYDIDHLLYLGQKYDWHRAFNILSSCLEWTDTY